MLRSFVETDLPLKEIVSAPIFYDVLADRLFCVIPLAELTTMLPALVADRLMVSVPTRIEPAVPVAVINPWLILALATVILPVLEPLIASLPRTIAPVELIVV